MRKLKGVGKAAVRSCEPKVRIVAQSATKRIKCVCFGRRPPKLLPKSLAKKYINQKENKNQSEFEKNLNQNASQNVSRIKS